MQQPIHIGEIMQNIIPEEIIKILKKLHDPQKTLTDLEDTKLNSFLCTLETSIVDPVMPSKVLTNPIPNEPDLTVTREESAIDRIRHINTVSARVNALNHPESEEEANDFSMDDDFHMPRSVFEVRDHEIVDMEPDPITPSKEREGPNPDLVSEADPLPPEADPLPPEETE